MSTRSKQKAVRLDSLPAGTVFRWAETLIVGDHRKTLDGEIMVQARQTPDEQVPTSFGGSSLVIPVKKRKTTKR